MQAKELIDNSIDIFEGGLGYGTINSILNSVSKEIQLRDYLIGLPMDHAIEKCSDFLSYLTTNLPADISYPLDTVNAMYQYEMGNTQLCNDLLDKVAIANEEYSLAQLVRRAISAEWPASQFGAMRKELHARVIERLNELAGVELA